MMIFHPLRPLRGPKERREERQKDRLVRRLARETRGCLEMPIWWKETKTIFPREDSALPKYETVEDLTTELKIPATPTAFPSQVEYDFLEEYQKIASDLDYHPAKIMNERNKKFFLENNIPIYHNFSVDKYLTYLADQKKQWWIWRPLREKDSQCTFLMTGHNRDFSVTNSLLFHHGSYAKKLNYFSYRELVPISILILVKKIEENLDKDLVFFVSDCFVHKSNRFIMACSLKAEVIIFGAWDGSMPDEEFLK